MECAKDCDKDRVGDRRRTFQPRAMKHQSLQQCAALAKLLVCGRPVGCAAEGSDEKCRDLLTNFAASGAAYGVHANRLLSNHAASLVVAMALLYCSSACPLLGGKRNLKRIE